MTPAAWLFGAIVAGIVIGTEYFCWRTGREVRSLQRRTEAQLERIASRLKEIR